MCRFLHLFDEKQETEKLEFNETDSQTEAASSNTTTSTSTATAAAAATATAAAAAAAAATPSQKYAVANTSLPLPVLSVYLFARGCLLHEPYEVIQILIQPLSIIGSIHLYV